MKKVFSLFDEDSGELVRRVETNYSSMLGSDWIVVYTNMIKVLVDDNPPYSVVRVYLKLASMQTFDLLVVTSVAHLARELDMTYNTAWKAVNWLIEKNYMKKTEHQGQTAFLLNPNFTTRGRASLPEKRRLWNMNFDDPKVKADIEQSAATVSNRAESDKEEHI